jgi:hypothetical protein
MLFVNASSRQSARPHPPACPHFVNRKKSRRRAPTALPISTSLSS